MTTQNSLNVRTVEKDIVILIYTNVYLVAQEDVTNVSKKIQSLINAKNATNTFVRYILKIHALLVLKTMYLNLNIVDHVDNKHSSTALIVGRDSVSQTILR